MPSFGPRTYLVQVHGEWSGIPEYDWMDVDYEVNTLEDAWRIVKAEVPRGVPYMIYDPDDRLIEEGTK